MRFTHISIIAAQACIRSSGSKYHRGVLHHAWSQWIGEFWKLSLSSHPSRFSALMPLRGAVMYSLDDDCLISPKARAVFLERIHHSFGVRPDDKAIKALTKDLKDLICHNTDLSGKS
jgi:hypothetical protein